MSAAQFTVCALLYGDHPDLARRCLTSIVTCGGPIRHLRIGLNAVSAATRQVVHELAPQAVLYDSAENIHKYPMMRRMFYEHGLNTPYVMWFDDDSYLKKDIFATVSHKLSTADMVGALYTMRWRGKQKEWITQQSWFNKVPPAEQARFATGGWWAIRTSVLTQYDYPWPVLDHRGGDVMLGELCRQHSLRLLHYNKDVAINADETGRESRAKRRGFDQVSIGIE